MPAATKNPARRLGMVLYRADKRLLSSFPRARRAAAYIHISGMKGKE
jgi:hypothetical protein